MNPPVPVLEGTRGPFRDLVDYILGITHEIWESRQVDRIRDYYAADTLIYTLGGLVRGAESIVQNTHDTLRAFPDRLLIGDAVIWSRESAGIFYSSHRISSPMTNLGDSAFGPATGRSVVVATIADCLVENGVITREWLVRDNHALVTQLGFDPHTVAQRAAAQPRSSEFTAWLDSESERVRASDTLLPIAHAWDPEDPAAFARSALANAWQHGDAAAHARYYAPYAVLHESRPVASGRDAIDGINSLHRRALANVALSMDHLCVCSLGAGQFDIAARWMLRGVHRADWLGVPATGAEIMILGVTHWHVVAGRIAAEWTIFDRMAVLAQMYRARG